MKSMKRNLLNHVNKIAIANPMLGFRGLSFGSAVPRSHSHPVSRYFEAACQVKGERKQVTLENHGAVGFDQ